MAARRVLMVEPFHFFPNPETLEDNFFQHSHAGETSSINKAAAAEFNSLKEKLIEKNIGVTVFRQENNNASPDAVFPNNWFSTHPDGSLVLYPMKSELRRTERRADIVQTLGGRYPHFIDLTFLESNDSFLEGTGSLVIDHKNKVVFASLSARTSETAVNHWASLMNYSACTFTSADAKGHTIYHTNVMMCLAEKFAIVCLDAVLDPAERKNLAEKIQTTGRSIIPISLVQMNHFCGNCIVLEQDTGKEVIVMSDQAFRNFENEQLDLIKQSCTIIHSNLETIEKYGGGGARCMLAELF